MPIVTESLLTLIRAQIKTRGAVVWYDPEGVYRELAHTLAPEQMGVARICCYTPETGFLSLRHDLEAWWGAATEAPRLLIYVPLAQTATQHALIEFEAGGGVLQPGQPQECNTALAFVARRALEGVFPAARLEALLAQVEDGQLSLAELDQEAERIIEQQAGVLKVIFGAGNPAEIALRFAADAGLDAEITTRGAQSNLAGLLGDLLGVSFSTVELAELRARLVRQLLTTDFIQALGEALPLALQTFPLAAQPVARETAAALAATWRNRRDLTAAYVTWAAKIESALGLTTLALSLEALERAETFRVAELALLTAVEQALLRRPTAALCSLAQARGDRGFWAQHDPELKTRWEVVAVAAEVLLESARVQGALKGKSWSAEALLGQYAYGDVPWSALDTAQRHLERDAHRFDFEPEQHPALQQLVAGARQAYAAAADALARAFVQAYAEANFTLPSVLLQADIYREHVAPLALRGRTAYILVDALRFEMARELQAILADTWPSDLTAALATPPTITEVGMAALLPGAERGLTLTETGGKLALALAGATLRTRQERVAYFQKTVGKGVAVAKLEELAPLTDRQLGQALDKATVILVTATEEIDGLCESNPSLARRMLDDVFNQLRRALKTLFNHGVQAVVITADHGYLFGDGLSTGALIDAPGGKELVFKRRVWVGQGGADAAGTLRAPITAFGIGGPYDLVTPRGLACFKKPGGAMEYFHGGLSLPEVTVPVLTVRATGAGADAPGASIAWQLTLGSATGSITTRFVSVNVAGSTAQLLPLTAPLARVEVRAGTQPISVPVSAAYGFDETTKDVQLAVAQDNDLAIAPDTVAVQIVEEPDVATVTVYLLEATTGITLARLDNVPFKLTF